jgi:hypothetical protein
MISEKKGFDEVNPVCIGSAITIQHHTRKETKEVR